MKLPKNVKLLGWASFWNDIASEVVYPLLPSFLLSMLGGNRFYLGMIEGLSESLASLLKLWSGAWSDRIGNRKRFLIFGYSMAAIARPLTALLTAPWQLLLLRLSDRFGKGIRSAPRDAMMVDSTDPSMRGRAFGFQRGMDHLGAAIGPILATLFLLVFPDHVRWLFALTILPGIVVVCLIVFGLREGATRGAIETQSPNGSADQAKPLEAEPRISAPTGPIAILRSCFSFHLSYRTYLVAIVLFTLGNSTDAFLLVRAQELGVPVAWLPVLWSAFHLLKSGGSLVVGKQIDLLGPKRLLLLGWMVYGLTYLGFAFASNAWHMWGLFGVYSIFYALAEPSEKALVASLVSKDQRGLAYGWFNAAIGIAAFPASLLFGLMYESFGAIVAFGSGTLFAWFAALLLCWVKPAEQQLTR